MQSLQPQASFQALGHSSLDGVLVHAQRRIAYVNPALLRLLGFERDAQLIGRPLESIVYADDVSRLCDGVMPAGAPTSAGVPLRCVARDGRVLAVEASGTPCEFGGAEAYVTVVRDVTALRDREDALRRSQDELELQAEQSAHELAKARAHLRREAGSRGRAERALQTREEQLHQAAKMEAVGRLAGGIAHDFNNMLSIILSYSELVQRALPKDSALQEPLVEMARAAERAGELTRQLLTFSRRQVLEPRVVDPGKVVAGLQSMLRRLVGEDVELQLLPGERPANIRVDPNQLEQVIVNLVINARDAIASGGRITLGLRNVHVPAKRSREPAPSAGEYVLLSIGDTGVGMDKATLARIFEPFFTTKERDKGTGLGLSIVEAIVKQSGGHIAVESEPGGGTTFQLYFPAVTAAPPEPTPHSSDEPKVNGGHATVLVVEDDAGVRRLIATLLGGAGYDVLEAQSARAALALAQQHAGDVALLITDVVMPQLSGPKLWEALRAQHPQLRVLYISGYTDDTLQHHGVLSSALPFLQKPFTPDGLLARVRDALEHD